MNERYLNASNLEESSPIKTKTENFSEVIEHGYFYTVIKVLFTLVIYLYWIICCLISVCFLYHLIISIHFEIKFSLKNFLLAITICTSLYIIQLYVYSYTVNVAHVVIITASFAYDKIYGGSTLNDFFVILWSLYNVIRSLVYTWQLLN